MQELNMDLILGQSSKEKVSKIRWKGKDKKVNGTHLIREHLVCNSESSNNNKLQKTVLLDREIPNFIGELIVNPLSIRKMRNSFQKLKTKYCIECGHILNGKFCTNCGTRTK